MVTAAQAYWLNRKRRRARNEGVGIIQSIFADGTDGFYYDFSRLSKLWKDTAATTPVAAAGDNIARSDDSSPRGRNATQSTTAAQPKWQTGGRARFDGADDSLLTTLVPGPAMTLMAKVSVLTTPGRVFFGSTTSGAANRSYIGLSATGALGGGVGNDNSSVITGGGSILGATGVAALTYTGSSVSLYWNNTLIYNAAQNGSPNTTIQMIVGAYSLNGVGDAFFPGDLHHALAIKKALSASEIAAITNEWGTT